jgi:MFS family permease
MKANKPTPTRFFKGSTLIALKVRDFRLYWSGLVAQVVGQHMYQFTLGWLSFEITGSQAQLGLIHLCAFVPQFSLTLFGGALADRIDPRRLIQCAQALSAAGVIGVGILALLGRVEIWHLAAGAFLFGLVNAVDEPSRASFFPRLLPKTHLSSGIPLISMAFGTSRMIAPSIAGFVIAAAGAPSVFLLSAIGMSSMIAMLFLVRAGSGSVQAHGSLLGNVADSVRYIRANEVFSRVITVALLNAAFAMGYIHVLPVFAKVVLGVDARGLGLLASAAGMGALCGLFSYSSVQARTTLRNVMVYALSAYCCALIGVALSAWFWLSFVLLFTVGLGQAYFMTSCQVILQTLVEDRYRGRVMAMFTLVWSLVYLSGFLLNFTGSLVGPRVALAGGGAIVLSYLWLSLARSTALRRLVLAPKTS